MLKFGVHGT
ncbi:hypothetical protein B4U79_07944 [Dinothrombium tinctorium]|uniref:Uncharacterized protein n=1 Tax=Dinothrombium tinctorium TaxID=1965070 RepID=A0A443RHB5_9ACAR|nr:hypothetical protein B4U79_07944 [Dinothrombium tinctorium]